MDAGLNTVAMRVALRVLGDICEEHVPDSNDVDELMRIAQSDVIGQPLDDIAREVIQRALSARASSA